VPYLAVQDRYFVINYEDDVTSEYANVRLPNVKISGWTDRDIYFFEKVYADVSETVNDETEDGVIMMGEDIMGLLEPVVDTRFTSTPYTIVHNRYPLSINRNGEIIVYNNQPKNFPYVTSLFHTANVSQIKYGPNDYKPLTPYMYYLTKVEVDKRTKVEILYSYLNRFDIVSRTLQSEKVIRYARVGPSLLIDGATVTRNILLPVDYNILFYLESQFSRLLGNNQLRVFVRKYNGQDVEYPVILHDNSRRACNLLIFKNNTTDAIILNADTDLALRIMRWDLPMSFFAGGGLLGWGRHQPNRESKYYLFSWYKIMRTKRLVSNANRVYDDDYLRYYYYYQYII
jgi:hypothetical protein